jgi:excisionase family DNA binding protein
MDETSISLTEAAERLDVHYMTAYKYVRTGRLAAHKNGGQWRVDVSDLSDFESGVQETLAPRGDVIPWLIEERLLAGDENGTFRILNDAMSSGADADEVYLDLLGPAMSSIGTRWHDGEITIASEHLASSTAMRVISRLGSRLVPRGRSRGMILLATVSDDQHALPTAMIRDLLRFRGFDVEDLGANTPTTSVIERALESDDLIAVGLVATNSGSEHLLQATLSELNKALDVTVVVGGGAFTDFEQIARMGACVPSRSGRHALEIFERVHAELRAG